MIPLKVFQRTLSYLFITFCILISFLHVSLSQESGSSSKAGIMVIKVLLNGVWMDEGIEEWTAEWMMHGKRHMTYHPLWITSLAFWPCGLSLSYIAMEGSLVERIWMMQSPYYWGYKDNLNACVECFHKKIFQIPSKPWAKSWTLASHSLERQQTSLAILKIKHQGTNFQSQLHDKITMHGPWIHCSPAKSLSFLTLQQEK